MKKALFVSLILFLIIPLTSCVSGTKSLNKTNRGDIQEGKTTKFEIVQKLGEPNKKSNHPNIASLKEELKNQTNHVVYEVCSKYSALLGYAYNHSYSNSPDDLSKSLEYLNLPDDSYEIWSYYRTNEVYGVYIETKECDFLYLIFRGNSDVVLKKIETDLNQVHLGL
jgi:hypothetical protein